MRFSRASAMAARASSYAAIGVAWRADEPPQSVENPPGSTSVTWMPKPATSWARAWLNPSSAHFDAWYAPMLGNAEIPPIDDTWMMCPLPCARRNGSAACVTQNAPKRFVSIWSRSSAYEISSVKPNWP